MIFWVMEGPIFYHFTTKGETVTSNGEHWKLLLPTAISQVKPQDQKVW